MNNYKRSKIFGKKEKFNFFVILCLVIGVISAIYLTVKLSADPEGALAEKNTQNSIVQNDTKNQHELNINESTIENAIQVKDTLNGSNKVAQNNVDDKLKSNADNSKLANNIEKSDSNINSKENNTNNNIPKQNINQNEVAKDVKENNQATTTKETNVTEKDNDTVTVSTTKGISFVAPIEGSLIRGFSPDTIYSKTLNSWRTREGIDFKAEKGTNVVAALSGTVEKIDNDLTERGQYIVINHDGGFKTIYTNLDKEIKVVSGQKVKQGEVIAKVGNTSGNYSNEDYGAHLNFIMYLNNEEVNPADYITLK